VLWIEGNAFVPPFCRPIPQVTKAEIEAEKERLKAIDARPIKKIAEAKARKKQKLVKRLEQAKQKANVSLSFRA
jgi:AdoMet-dependent rRNA methyltransferase SPB1